MFAHTNLPPCVDDIDELSLQRFKGARNNIPTTKTSSATETLARSPFWCECFLFIMRHKRHIFIDPKLAGAAVGTKEATEALAVVLGIKITFVNSIVNNASAVRLMHILHIGHLRYKRAVSYALRMGWLVREGDNLRAPRIKAQGNYNVRLVFTRHYYRGKRSSDIRCPYTLTQLCNFIRQAVLLFHISKQAVVYDTITMATRKPTNSGERSKKTAANKRVESWGMRKPRLRKKANRLSYASMGELAGCSKSKAKSLMRPLIKNNIVSRHENYEKTKWRIEEYSKELRDSYAGTSGARGFLVRHNGQVMLRLANSYTLNKPLVKFCASGTKRTVTV